MRPVRSFWSAAARLVSSGRSVPVGLDVVEDGDGLLGRVTDVVPGVANDVLELDSGLALPMVEDCVRFVDLEAGRIVVASGYAGDG